MIHSILKVEIIEEKRYNLILNHILLRYGIVILNMYVGICSKLQCEIGENIGCVFDVHITHYGI